MLNVVVLVLVEAEDEPEHDQAHDVDGTMP
jgi:hypothetical protein